MSFVNDYQKKLYIKQNKPDILTIILYINNY